MLSVTELRKETKLGLEAIRVTERDARSDDLYGERIERAGFTVVLICLSSLRFLRRALTGHHAAPPPKPLAVEVTNASTPESCAEKDNVIINFASANVRRFQIGAVLPAYIGSVSADRREPNWTDCDIPHDADLPPPMERRITLSEIALHVGDGL